MLIGEAGYHCAQPDGLWYHSTRVALHLRRRNHGRRSHSRLPLETGQPQDAATDPHLTPAQSWDLVMSFFLHQKFVRTTSIVKTFDHDVIVRVRIALKGEASGVFAMLRVAADLILNIVVNGCLRGETSRWRFS